MTAYTASLRVSHIMDLRFSGKSAARRPKPSEFAPALNIPMQTFAEPRQLYG